MNAREVIGVDVEPGAILVVDDDRISRRILVHLLEQAGHQVRTAENGSTALDLLSVAPTDVVLLDIVMPEIDGFDVLERIKSTPALRHVRVVMISGVDDEASVVRCIEMGADDFLPKPFDPVIMRARVNASLSRKRLDDLQRE